MKGEHSLLLLFCPATREIKEDENESENELTFNQEKSCLQAYFFLGKSGQDMHSNLGSLL